jgi:hypothetical protein
MLCYRIGKPLKMLPSLASTEISVGIGQGGPNSFFPNDKNSFSIGVKGQETSLALTY